MIVFYACMEDYHPIYKAWSKLRKYKNQLMFQILVYSVICCGVILIKILMGGVKIREELAIPLELIMSRCFARKLIWILSVEPIRLLKKAMNFSPIDSSLQSSQLQITADNSITQEL
jgi:hypothetical protein